MANELSCKITRLYNPYSKWIGLLLFAGYLVVCYYYFTHFHEPMLQPVVGQLSFMGFLLLGIAAILSIPILFSITTSYLVFEKDGVVEHRGYIAGLIKVKEIFFPWSEFESWESGYGKVKGSQTKFYSLDLNFKHKGELTIPGSFGSFWHNGTEIKWKTFEQHLKALFNEVGLPDSMKDWEEIIQDDINDEK